MPLPPWLLPLAAAAGLLGGIVNTLAGGGAFLMLVTMLLGGIDAGTANGTLRVAILAQTLSATLTFYRQGVRDGAAIVRLVGPAVLGSLGGAALATRIAPATLRPLFGAVLALWAVLLALRPGRFVSPPEEPRAIGAVAVGLAALIGVYGGFIQAGAGFPLLGLLVSYLGYPAVRANGIKLALVAAYTIVALPVFIYAGQVAWLPAGALAAGSIVGAWIGVRLQLRVGAQLVRWALVIMIAVSGTLLLLR